VTTPQKENRRDCDAIPPANARFTRTDRHAERQDPDVLVSVLDGHDASANRIFAKAAAEQKARTHEAGVARLRQRFGLEPLPPRTWTWADRCRGHRVEPTTFAQRLRGEE
jgi:hypothetical protein